MSELKRTSWLIIFAVWLAFGLLYSLQSYSYLVTIGRPAEWIAILKSDVTYFILWSVIAVPLIHGTLRWPVSRTNWFVTLPVYVLSGFVVAFIQRAIFDAVYLYLESGSFEGLTLERWFRSVIGSFELGVFIFFTLVFVIHAWTYYGHLQKEKLHASELQAQLSQTQLQVLQSQLQPHFLFNALNTVSGLVDSQPQVAKLTIGRLGDLLRMVLETDQAPEISLNRELEFTDVYLSIQETRFGDRLTVVRDILADTLEAAVPTMLLQPLIENAVEHGIARIPGRHTMRVIARRKDAELELCIENDFATTVPHENSQGFGIGLSNTEARLEKLYGKAAHFEIQFTDHGARATVRLPFRRKDA